MGLIVIMIFFGIVSYVVSNKLKSKFAKYSKIGLQSGLSGKEIAEKMLSDHGIYDVKVTSVKGKLTDHYNPATKIVNLSEAVYHGRSTTSAAVAAHECGHAVQHATAYGMLELRSTLVPLQNVSAKVINFIFMTMLFGAFFLPTIIPFQLELPIIIGCYTIFTLFAFITLPVEFDASKRALQWIIDRRVVNSNEHAMAKDALKWAAMTYVVVAVGSLVTLLFYVMMFLGARD